MDSQDNKVFLDFFERNYARCYSYVKLTVADDMAVKDIITSAMKTLWKEHLTGGKSVNDLGRLVGLLDAGARKYLVSRSTTDVKVYKSSKDISSFTTSQIDLLPSRRREIFLLSRVQGMKSSEIAAQMSISPRTVEKHIELALKQLKQIDEQKK